MDADLLAELYRQYYPSAYAYCLTLCGDEHLAQDIVADAFVKAYLSLPNDVPSFRYWLLRVCKNLWIDHLRRRQHETTDEPLQYLADPSTPERSYLESERTRTLYRAIAALPPPDRELVTLHYISGVPLHEAARLMNKSYPSVRQRMTRLRRTLKQYMEEHGYGNEL